ncbi:lactosylceramide alpha-2,3-sialyltransferase [Eleutherodactylus coqui]|uniref:lactosylceramide alpha-2,3-sialyltransferase n=1 Tax=Eleutherodactylus coqui TaxID=57060 RepID=UPI003463029A
MKRLNYTCCCKYFLRILFVIIFLITSLYICKVGLDAKPCDRRAVDPDHIKNAHTFAKSIMEAQCRPGFARREMERLFGNKYNMDLEGFLKKNKSLNKSLYQYAPPFGFGQYLKEVDDVLEMITDEDLPMALSAKDCRRCIVIGSGGILHGLQLGSAINNYDIVIRLNSAPVHGYERDVGHNTTIRLTYPEGAPVSEQEYFNNSLFVNVLFKHADLLWLQAILKNEKLSTWNKLFFWKGVVEKLPVKAQQIRILNPLIVKETALDILQFPPPQWKWWGWAKNIPTIGAVAVVLATHLCDEVSIAGFGYDLSQPNTPLHYFDNLCMDLMNHQPMHDIDKEKKLLQTLVREGVVKDLSGGLHCEFCPSHQTHRVSTTA